MSEQAFGIKKIELKGSGIPTFNSPTDLNLNAVTVAISTNVSIGGSIVSNVIVGNGYSVGIGTTNPTSALTVGGGTSTRELYVTGVSTFRNSLDIFSGISFKTASDSSIFDISYESNNDDITFSWQQSGGTGGSQIKWFIPETSSFVMRNPAIDEKLAQFTTGGSVELYYDGSNKFETIGAGVTVTGTTFTNQLSVSGVSTFNDNVGIGTTNPTSKLTVRGGDVSVGVSTSHGVILTSPNGTQYRLFVENDGTLKTVSA
jgi:hypothetical protein